MKKIFALITVLALGFAASAASSVTRGGYVHWTLDPVTESIKFAYVAIASQDAGGTKEHLTIGNTGETIAFDAKTYLDGTTDIGAEFYSAVVNEVPTTSYFIELYDLDGNVIATSQAVTYSDLVSGGYVYQDMSTTGVLNTYHFQASSAPIPEPTGGVLLALGLCVLALKRKHEEVA